MIATTLFRRVGVPAGLTALAMLFLFSLPHALAAQTTRYGDSVAFGAGTARTYLMLDADGQPAELGVAISTEGLASPPEATEGPPDEPTVSVVLPLPEGAPAPYRFAMLDWNPLGHIPKGVYDVPHFDIHFYTITDADREAILPDDPDYAAKAARAPDSTMMPAGYFLPPETTVPMMGTHWLSESAAELHGQPFTATFIYGTWDGRIAFVEPMVTQATLESDPDMELDVPVPARAAEPGYYPSRYALRHDPESGDVRIALTGFVYRN